VSTTDEYEAPETGSRKVVAVAPSIYFERAMLVIHRQMPSHFADLQIEPSAAARMVCSRILKPPEDSIDYSGATQYLVLAGWRSGLAIHNASEESSKG
jgi:hypothetical protein